MRHILPCLGMVLLFVVVAIPLVWLHDSPAQFTTPSAGGGTSDSLGIDTDGDGVIDNYLYSTAGAVAVIKKGANITLTVEGDSVTVAGPTGAGTADSVAVDTTGDGAIDAYLYSSAGAIALLRKGERMIFNVAIDTLYLNAENVAVSDSGAAFADSTDQITHGNIKDWHIDFGTGTGQVSSDDVTEGSSNLYDKDLADSSNWSTAYAWGNHAAQNYLDDDVADDVDDGDLDWGSGVGQIDTDDLPEGSTNKYDQPLTDSSNWSTAYSWGDHGAQNYLDDDTEDDVDDLDIDWGTGAGQVNTDDVPEGSSNLYDQLLPDSGNWSTAYSWGDHSTQNYLDDDVGQDIDGDDIDSTDEDFVFNDAYRITSEQPDSMFMTRGYIDATAGGLTPQCVKGDHVDSTLENFVFNDAYRITSAEAESMFMSRAYIDAAAGGLTPQSVKGDHVDSTSEDFVFDDAYRITSEYTDSMFMSKLYIDNSDDTITHETVEDVAGGMATGNTETGITVTYQDDDGTMDYEVDTATIYGAIHDTVAANGCNYLDKDIDDTDDLSQGSTNLYDQPLPDSTNWTAAYYWGNHAAQNYLDDDVEDDVDDGDIDFGTGAGQVSSDDVPEGSTNKYDQALPDSVNWSTAYGWGDHSGQNYLDDDVGQDVDGDDLDSTLEDFVFNDAYHITSAEPESMFMSKAYIDAAAGGLTPQSVKGDHVDSTLEDFVFNDAYRITSEQADSMLMTKGYIDLLWTGLTDTTWDLKDGFIWSGAHEFTGGTPSLEIPNADAPSTAAEGQIAWDANDDAIEVFSGDESESVLLPIYYDIEAMVFAPDGVNDYIPIFHVDALLYPHGIEIDQLSITLPTSTDYTLPVHEVGSDHAFDARIDSLVVSSAQYLEDDSPMDGNLDADDYIYLNVPSTGVDWIFVKIIYHVTEGN